MTRILFYIISFTWGSLMSAIGFLGTLIFIPFGERNIFHGRIYTVIGANWGGLCLGCFFFVSKSCMDSNHTRGHECGHGLQNCLWGPLFPFVIGIPSAMRYTYRNWRQKHGKINKTAYDDIWFEKQATQWGKKYIITDIF